MNEPTTYEEAIAAGYTREQAKFTEWDPMFGITVRPPTKDEILSDDERVPDLHADGETG